MKAQELRKAWRESKGFKSPFTDEDLEQFAEAYHLERLRRLTDNELLMLCPVESHEIPTMLDGKFSSWEKYYGAKRLIYHLIAKAKQK